MVQIHLLNNSLCCSRGLCSPLPWSFHWAQSSQVGRSAGGWRDWASWQWGWAGGQQQVVHWRQQTGLCAPPDAALWICGRPRCRQPGSWSHAGRGWPLSLGWSIELEDVSLHFWPVSPLSTACTLAWRRTNASEAERGSVQAKVCIWLVSEVVPRGKCELEGPYTDFTSEDPLTCLGERFASLSWKFLTESLCGEPKVVMLSLKSGHSPDLEGVMKDPIELHYLKCF